MDWHKIIWYGIGYRVRCHNLIWVQFLRVFESNYLDTRENEVTLWNMASLLTSQTPPDGSKLNRQVEEEEEEQEVDLSVIALIEDLRRWKPALH